jgi:hypothetical protein
MMIRSAFAFLVLALAAGAAMAEPKWNGAGWYQIEDIDIDGWIYAGPFGSKEACDAALPADDDMAVYYCEYLETKPSWDY